MEGLELRLLTPQGDISQTMLALNALGFEDVIDMGLYWRAFLPISHPAAASPAAWVTWLQTERQAERISGWFIHAHCHETQWDYAIHPSEVETVQGRFWLAPEGFAANPPSDAHPIWLRNRRTFGTGAHVTTQSMIQFLARFIEPKMQVLDFGTGNGVLSVVAKALGAGMVQGCDLEAWMAEDFRYNMQRNGFLTGFSFTVNPDFLPHSFDLICANTPYQVQEKQVDSFFKWLKPHGLLLVAGLAQMAEMQDLQSRYSAKGFRLKSTINWEGWHSFVLQKS